MLVRLVLIAFLNTVLVGSYENVQKSAVLENQERKSNQSSKTNLITRIDGLTHLNGVDADADDNNWIVVLPDCQAFVHEFSKNAAQFIKCSVDNARPFRFCEGCVAYFTRTLNVYKTILQVGQGDTYKVIMSNAEYNTSSS